MSRAIGHPLRARHRARSGAVHDADAAGDGGFVLLESIMAISLITVIMSALAVMFVSSLSGTAHERTRAGAARVATTALDDLNSRDATSLVSGRTSSCTYPPATTAVTTYLASMTDARDADPSSTVCNPTVSITGTSVAVGTTTYTVNDYLGWCSYTLAADGTSTCVKSSLCPSVGGKSCYLRAVVAVSWAGNNCTPSSCTYVTSTLISAKIDPTFKVNQPLPPIPVITDPGNQISAVGDTVNLQLLVQQNTGVPPFTWAATGLPGNLAVNPAGLVSNGTQTLVQNASPATVTVTVTDAFLRQSTRTFTWRVFPQLVPTTPGPQPSLTTDSVNLALHATGGQGAPYTWSLDSGSLPPGLTINSTTSGDGSITGTPTTPGQYSFALDVRDASTTRTATTTTITWTVKYPPIVGSNPGAQTDTVGTARTLQLSASGGSGQAANYRWSSPDNSLAGTGLTMSSSGKITGSLTSTAKDVTVNLQVTDVVANTTDSVTFVWHVVAKPTIAGPGSQAMTETGNQSVALAYTCPNGSCVITLTSAPPGLGLDTSSSASSANSTTQLTVGSGSGTVWITGIVSTSAVTVGNSKMYSPSVTITDSDSVATTPSAGTWTVNVVPTLTFAPTATSPATVQFPISRALSGASATASLGSAGYTYAFSGTKPSWLSINASTGALTGTTPGSRQAFTFTVVATDSDGVSATGTVTWYADDLALAVPDATVLRFTLGATRAGLSTYRSGGSGGYTYAAASLPPTVTLNSAGTFGGTFTTAGTYTTTFYVTDSIGTTVADNATYTVT